MPFTEQDVRNMRIFSKAFTSYEQLLRRVNKGRSPTEYGVPHSSYRLFRVDGTEPRIDIYNRKHKVAEVTRDNIVTFKLTRQGMASIGNRLSATLHRLVPVICSRVRTGEYRLMAQHDYIGLDSLWRAPASAGQEYFEMLKLDLSTGKIINSRDMTPIVNTDKRKQWLSGLKNTRLLLRAAARVGALEGRRNTGSHGYLFLSRERVGKIAECIMNGKLDDDCIAAIAQSVARYRLKDFHTEGEAIVDRFETLMKSHSREMRLHVGVIDISE